MTVPADYATPHHAAPHHAAETPCVVGTDPQTPCVVGTDPQTPCVVGTDPHRAARRPPQNIEVLSDRIRALQRAEPRLAGDLRTDVLAELATIQLQAERLSLAPWRSGTHQAHTDAEAAALTEQVDRLSIHWPLGAEPGPIQLGPLPSPTEGVRS